jgi:hypothetical protein
MADHPHHHGDLRDHGLGPIAAFWSRFPTIRYTSMSLPYHIGNGWFGEYPCCHLALWRHGSIYAGLWYRSSCR